MESKCIICGRVRKVVAGRCATCYMRYTRKKFLNIKRERIYFEKHPIREWGQENTKKPEAPEPISLERELRLMPNVPIEKKINIELEITVRVVRKEVEGDDKGGYWIYSKKSAPQIVHVKG